MDREMLRGWGKGCRRGRGEGDSAAGWVFFFSLFLSLSLLRVSAGPV